MSLKNKVILIGGVGRDPEVKKMDNGNTVVNLSVATEDGYMDKNGGGWKTQTEWHNCVAYGKIADGLAKCINKGSQIFLEGKLHTSSWDDKNGGGKRYKTEVIVESWGFQKGNSRKPDDQQSSNAGFGGMNDDMPF